MIIEAGSVLRLVKPEEKAKYIILAFRHEKDTQLSANFGDLVLVLKDVDLSDRGHPEDLIRFFGLYGGSYEWMILYPSEFEVM